jgi:hypothetical protein
MFEFTVRGNLPITPKERQPMHKAAKAYNAQVKATFERVVKDMESLASKFPELEFRIEGFTNDLTEEDGHGLALGPVEHARPVK